MKKNESKEEIVQGDFSVNPFPLGEIENEAYENQEYAPVVAVQSERDGEFAIADENIAEETKLEDSSSNPFGEAVSSARNSFSL